MVKLMWMNDPLLGEGLGPGLLHGKGAASRELGALIGLGFLPVGDEGFGSGEGGGHRECLHARELPAKPQARILTPAPKGAESF